MSWTRCYSTISLILLFGREDLCADPPAVLAKTVIDRLLPGPLKNASPVFLSENTLALLLKPKAQMGQSKVLVLRLANGNMRVVSETSKADHGDQIFSVSTDLLLIAEAREKILYSLNLRQKWVVPIKTLSKQFPLTEFAGEANYREQKNLFRLTKPPTAMPVDHGQLLAASNENLVHQLGNTIRITTSEGETRGSISIAPQSFYFNQVEIAASDRLYFSAVGQEKITDFSGKTIIRVQPPEGWGSRHGWNSDGTRLLFDRYRFKPSLEDRLLGTITKALGSVLPEEANIEVVRVIEVATGAICFDIQVNGLLGQAGGYHADLSPSGRLLAVATLTDVKVYSLPLTCSAP